MFQHRSQGINARNDRRPRAVDQTEHVNRTGCRDCQSTSLTGECPCCRRYCCRRACRLDSTSPGWAASRFGNALKEISRLVRVSRNDRVVTVHVRRPGHTWLGVHAEREYYRYRTRFYDDGGTFPVTGALVEYIAAPALSSSPRRLLRAPTRITALPFKTSLPSRWWRARPTLLPRTPSRPGIRTITRSLHLPIRVSPSTTALISMVRV